MFWIFPPRPYCEVTGCAVAGTAETPRNNSQVAFTQTALSGSNISRLRLRPRSVKRERVGMKRNTQLLFFRHRWTKGLYEEVFGTGWKY